MISTHPWHANSFPTSPIGFQPLPTINIGIGGAAPAANGNSIGTANGNSIGGANGNSTNFALGAVLNRMVEVLDKISEVGSGEKPGVESTSKTEESGGPRRRRLNIRQATRVGKA